MVEIITDMTTIWVSIVLTVLLVAAMTKANVLLIEWELRANWKKQFVCMNEREPVSPILIHLSRKQYKPKIPSTSDHNNQDDEDASPVVFV